MLHLISSCRDRHLGGAPNGDAAQAAPARRGFTVLELVIAMAIVAVLAAIAIPMYENNKEKIKVKKAIQDITQIQTGIDQWAVENRYTYPDSLADAGMSDMIDPWNTPYQYTNLTKAKGKGSARKDKSLVPINSDYDLWSNGPDGKSVAPLTAKASRDDIVRANNGRYVGPAADY